MREIKFRAWIKNSKEMILVQELYWARRIDNGTFLPAGVKRMRVRPFNHNEVRRFWENEIELMQFTGLHDKNGKEIWEGDLVRDFHVISAGTVCEVYYKPPSFRISGNGGYWPMNEYNPNGYEVIVNIYEHPHLLENK